MLPWPPSCGKKFYSKEKRKLKKMSFLLFPPGKGFSLERGEVAQGGLSLVVFLLAGFFLCSGDHSSPLSTLLREPFLLPENR